MSLKINASLIKNNAGIEELALLIEEGNNIPVPSAIQSFLANNLPKYMVPSSIYLVGKLPELTSGKVNRSVSIDIMKKMIDKGSD